MNEKRFHDRRSAHIQEAETPAAEAPPAEPETPAAPAAAPGPEAVRPAAPSPAAEAPAGEAGPADLYGPAGLPAPSFVEIVQVFALQALQFLGEVPLNEAGERHVYPEEAKHFIDLLGILEQKTRGNLTPEETRFLEQLLSDLRLRYLKVQS